MKVQLQMLGTGSAFAKKYYNNNALFTCNGYRLLVDCGMTAPRALYELGVELDSIDGIFITHLHADHVGGLEEIAFRMKFVYGKKPVLIIPSALRIPLWEHTLKGGMEAPEERMTGLEDYFDVRLMDVGQAFEIIDGFTLEILLTKHIPGKPSFSLIINEKLFYSADMRFDRELIDHLYAGRKCAYILHDCQLQMPGAVHAALDELVTLPAEIQRIVRLMHYGDDMEKFISRTGKMTFVRQHEIYDFAL